MVKRSSSAFVYWDTLLCLDLVLHLFPQRNTRVPRRVADSIIRNAKFKMNKEHLIPAGKQATFFKDDAGSAKE